MSDYLTLVRDAEILALSAGTIAERPRVFLILNPNDSFEPTTLSISPEQARRLVNDLIARFRESKILPKAESSCDEAKQVYEKIMFGTPDQQSVEARNER